MRNLNVAFLASMALTSSAFAGDGITVGAKGIVTGETPMTVTLNAKAGVLLNKKDAGATCVFRPGDTYEVVGIDTDGSAIVKRHMHVRLAKPSMDTCPTGSIAKIPAPTAVAGIKAAEAEAAEHAAKTGKKQ
jgi:acyl-CoA hydrolase